MNTSAVVSVIIPVQNRAQLIHRCIAAVQQSTYRNLQIIVVDDASTDGTPDAARRAGAEVLCMPVPGDANSCRHAGAVSASGDILLFLDSDVLITPASIAGAVDALKDTSIAAVVGTYTLEHSNSNLASRYKNLWIRYSYYRSVGKVDWVFGAITAVRRTDYVASGGFDVNYVSGKGGEDLELGTRLTRLGKRIVFSEIVEAEHLKRHSMASLLENDFRRSEGFFLLAASQGKAGSAVNKGFANIYPSFILSTLLSLPTVLGVAAAAVEIMLLPASLALGALYLALNSGFLLYYARHQGPAAASAVVLVLVADHTACALGSGKGLLTYILRKTGILSR